MSEIEGICAALCAPFDTTGEALDEGRFVALIDDLLAAGMHGFVLCSGTGEFAYLRPEERRAMTELGCRHIGGRATKIVQTSAMNQADAIEWARHATDAGADALMVLPPWFEGPGEAGVLRFYEAIARAVECEIVVYNLPQASNFDITPALYARLLQIDNITSIKDSTGDITRIQELVATGGRVLNGADPIALYSLLAGCPGCIWGAANVMPAETVRLYEAVKSGELAAAMEIWSLIAPANLHFWRSLYIPTIKAATNMMGRSVGPCRQPLQPLSDAEMAALETVLAPLKAAAC